MSSFAVKVEKVLDVLPHSNADRLDVILVLGWRCVVQKGSFQKGDLCVYFPIDSILPAEVEDTIFGPESKIKLNKSRIRTIKLRGEISQGLAVNPETLFPLLEAYERREGGHVYGLYESLQFEGSDVTDVFNVTKYEPPEASLPRGMQGSAASKKQINPNFAKYTDIENAKNHPDIFEIGELVAIYEKIHGTNFRAGYVPIEVNTVWKKIKKFFHLLPDREFVYGSRNVQMQNRYKGGNTTFYQQNGTVA